MTTTVPVAVYVLSGGTIACNPSTAIVNTANSLLSFTLMTPGFAFPSSNAVVVSGSATSFPYSSWTISSSSAALMDTCSETGDFNYTVTVVSTTSGESLSLDPVIRNTNVRA